MTTKKFGMVNVSCRFFNNKNRLRPMCNCDIEGQCPSGKGMSCYNTNVTWTKYIINSKYYVEVKDDKG